MEVETRVLGVSSFFGREIFVFLYWSVVVMGGSGVLGLEGKGSVGRVGETTTRVALLTTTVLVVKCNTVHKRTTAMLSGTVGLYVRYIKVKWRGAWGVAISNTLSKVSSNHNGSSCRCPSTRLLWEESLREKYGSHLYAKARLLFLSNYVENISSQYFSNYGQFFRIWVFLLRGKFFCVSQHFTQAVYIQVFVSIQVISKTTTWSAIWRVFGRGTWTTSLCGV